MHAHESAGINIPYTIWKSEDKLWGLFPSFHHAGPRLKSSPKLRSRRFYALSHLTVINSLLYIVNDVDIVFFIGVSLYSCFISFHLGLM